MVKKILEGVKQGLIYKLFPEFAPNSHFDINLLKNVPEISRENKQLILSFAAGRSGQRWTNKIFTSHQNCNGACERFPDFEAYYRFVTWNKLPIDLSGFYDLLEKASDYDWQNADISIHSSPYFAFGIEELTKKLKPDYLFFHLRKPEDVINSNYLKGWYAGDFLHLEKDKVLGIQPLNLTYLHRNLGRIYPKDDFWDEWTQLTQIGKISWYYTTLNTYLYEKFKKLTNTKQWFFKLSDIDQNYDYYRFLAQKFELSPLLSKKEYLLLKGKMKNKGAKRRNISDWTSQEKKEYERFVDPFMDIYNEIKTTGL